MGMHRHGDWWSKHSTIRRVHPQHSASTLANSSRRMDSAKQKWSDDEGVDCGSDFEDTDDLYFKNPPRQQKCCWLCCCGLCFTSCIQLDLAMRYWCWWMVCVFAGLAVGNLSSLVTGKFNEEDEHVTQLGQLTYTIAVFYDLDKYVITLMGYF